jgi:hypothetical protein
LFFWDLTDTSGWLSWAVSRIIAAINDEAVPCCEGSRSKVYLEKAFNGTGWTPEGRMTVARELGEASVVLWVHPTRAQAEIDKKV